MATQNSNPLILFSGLAADANVFAPQKLAFPQLIVPAWPAPEPNESLDRYCDRLATNLNWQGTGIIGGASFGGIIALHLAQHLKPSAVILIGSVRSPGELPRYARLARHLKPLVPLIPVRLLQICMAPMASKLGRRFFPHLCGLARQFCGADPTVFKWSLSQILDWKTTPDPGCPVFQIHGDRDHVLPVRYTHPDQVVTGAGHVISLTHPAAVNDFIRGVIAKSSGETF